MQQLTTSKTKAKAQHKKSIKKIFQLYMTILAWIEDRRRLKLQNMNNSLLSPKVKRTSGSESALVPLGQTGVDSKGGTNTTLATGNPSKGLWTRCDRCSITLYVKHLKENQQVCFGCGNHLQMSSSERISHLIDEGTWRPLDDTLSPCDPLQFQDQRDYVERLQEAQQETGLRDAVETGTGFLDGLPIALGVMDFRFLGGSMGSVVGEKITRLIEYATQEKLPLVLVCASGGARMQEGILSLMQMAKTAAALKVYQTSCEQVFISVLTSPTTGGVTASFAMLGDLLFAEPKALIGFAGRRVIEQTLQQEQLGDDFQTAEYLLDHGLLDLIVPRYFLKQALWETLTLYNAKESN